MEILSMNVVVSAIVDPWVTTFSFVVALAMRIQGQNLQILCRNQARTRLAFAALLVRLSREKPGALQSPLAMKAPPHTTIKPQLKRLLSGRVVGGGDVHVAFVAGDVRERLAIQETGGHAAKVAPNVDGGAGLHLGTEGGVCAVQAASGSKIAFGCTKNLA